MTAVGGPDVLELQDVERPEPVQTEVVVRVAAAGINPGTKPYVIEKLSTFS